MIGTDWDMPTTAFVPVRDAQPVKPTTGVCVVVGVLVAVGVAVFVGVGVSVFVGVKVLVGVADGVMVPVEVEVGTAVVAVAVVVGVADGVAGEASGVVVGVGSGWVPANIMGRKVSILPARSTFETIRSSTSPDVEFSARTGTLHPVVRRSRQTNNIGRAMVRKRCI